MSQATQTTESEVTPKTRKKRVASPMTDEHKAALKAGREYGKIVRTYLEALDSHKPRRGRKVAAEEIQHRIESVDKDLAAASAFERLNLLQQKMDLEAQLRRGEETVDMGELEKQFIQVVKPYAERRKLSYKAFRDAGVPTTVLKEAGLEKAS